MIPVAPTFRTIDGLSIRFVESGPGNADALLLSPWPESVFAYEPTWSRLAETTHLVAIDLPGFGRSERSDALMTPSAMGEFHRSRGRRLWARESAHRRSGHRHIGRAVRRGSAAGRFRSFVVGSGGSAVPLQLGEPLNEWIFAPDLEPYRRIDGRQTIEQVTHTLERYVVSPAAREDYLASYEGTRFAESMRYVRSYPAELEVLRDLLPQIETPVQIIVGRRDTAVPPVNAEYLHDRLPHSELRLVDANHFTWENAADEYATLVTAWWAGGSENCMKATSAVAVGD